MPLGGPWARRNKLASDKLFTIADEARYIAANKESQVLLSSERQAHAETRKALDMSLKLIQTLRANEKAPDPYAAAASPNPKPAAIIIDYVNDFADRKPPPIPKWSQFWWHPFKTYKKRQTKYAPSMPDWKGKKPPRKGQHPDLPELPPDPYAIEDEHQTKPTNEVVALGLSDFNYPIPKSEDVKEGETANLIASILEGTKLHDPLGLHLPVLDFDFPCKLVPSQTPDHFHLYIEKPVKWGAYKLLLMALLECGLLEHGYAGASISKGYTAVRPPFSHVKEMIQGRLRQGEELSDIMASIDISQI